MSRIVYYTSRRIDHTHKSKFVHLPTTNLLTTLFLQERRGQATSTMGNYTSKADAQTETAESFGGRSNGTAQAIMPASPRSAAPIQTAPPQFLTRRSRTMPTLTPNAKLPAIGKEKPSLTIDPRRAVEKDIDDSKSSICLSPGWDQGKKEKKEKRQREKEKKKQEEARKEAEKKARKEAEKQQAAANKAGKREGRLSKKPPPAAMDTQRMPSALRQQSDSRRNSILSVFSSGPSSGDSSRRSSRDLKRLSVASTESSNGQRRSQSTPASSTEIADSSGAWRSLVSGTAPQLPALPRFGLHSRNGSSGGSKSNSWGSEEAYSRELVKYASQLDQGSTSPQHATLVGNTIQSLKLARPLVRSQTDTALITLGQDQPVIKEVSRAVAERNGSKDAYRSSRSDPQGPLQNSGNNSVNDPRVDQILSTDLHVATKDRSGFRHAQYPTVHPLQANPIQIASSLDGGSYVHKERMRKQQQSLRGFQDEQAVKDATRTLEEEDQALPQEPVVGLSEGRETIMADYEAEDVPPVAPVPKVQAPEPIVESVDQYHGYVEESSQPQESIVLCNPDSIPAKRHTFLGMGLRSNPVNQPKHSSVAESMARSSEDTGHAKPLQPPRLHTNNVMDSTRPSKAEPILGHAPPQTPLPQIPIGRSRLSQAVVDKQRSPTGKPNSPVQGRTKLANAIVDKESPPRKNENSLVQVRPSPAQDGFSKEPQVQGPQLVRSHSRTRTSSSQLLNDSVLLPRSLPRSTTAPVLPSFSHEPFLLNHEEAAISRSAKAQVHVQTNEKALTDHTKPQLVAAAKRSVELPQTQPEPKRVPELVIESATPEGIVRKTSLKRPRSNPQLQMTTANPPVPSLDFLPRLKHQALVKPKPRSHLRNKLVPTDETARPSSSQFPVPAAPMHNALTPANNSAPNLTISAPRSPKRPTSQLGPHSHTSATLDSQRPLGPPNRMSTGGRPAGLGKTVAKLIVTCCSCTRWIDLPSDLFEAMAMPVRLTKLDGSAAGKGEARLDTAVQCPWCAHCMTTHCCSTDTWVCNKHNGFL